MTSSTNKQDTIIPPPLTFVNKGRFCIKLMFVVDILRVFRNLDFSNI